MDVSETFLLLVFEGDFELRFELMNSLPGLKTGDIITYSVDSGLKPNCERICGENAGNWPLTSAMVVSAVTRIGVWISSNACSLACHYDKCSAWHSMLVDTLFLPKVDGLF